MSTSAVESWNEILESLRRLDAHRYTYVGLRRDSATHLFVVGGRGNYVVSLSLLRDETEAIYTLASGVLQQGGDVELVIGGQLGVYPAKAVVNLDTAIEAAQDYFDGAMMPRGNWVREPQARSQRQA